MEAEKAGLEPAIVYDVIVHDESTAHAKDMKKMRWGKVGEGIGTKTRGQSRHVSAYCSECVGVLDESIEWLNPGGDVWWTGAKFMLQVPKALAEYDRKVSTLKYKRSAAVIYDNSSNHDCAAPDALHIEKVNILPGGVTNVMRKGWYANSDGEKEEHSFLFELGDTLHVNIGKVCKIGKVYESGYTITSVDDELIGCRKGAMQILHERKVKYETKATPANQNMSIPCKQSKKADELASIKKEATDRYDKSIRKGLCAEVQEQRLEELNDIREVIRIHSTAEGAKISAKTKTDAKKALQKAEEAYKMSLPPTAEEKSEACIYLLSLPTAEQVRYEVGCVECDCCKCVLKRQQDFLSQKTGIEEVFDKYNAEHGTKHRCIFLPKFHPELNYIERVWGRMKYFIRQYCDNTFETLKNNMKLGLEPNNLPLPILRRLARGTIAYLIAYKNEHDIVSAEAWVRQQRKHRSYSDRMDQELENLYFPNGHPDTEVRLMGDGELHYEVLDLPIAAVGGEDPDPNPNPNPNDESDNDESDNDESDNDSINSYINALLLK